MRLLVSLLALLVPLALGQPSVPCRSLYAATGAIETCFLEPGVYQVEAAGARGGRGFYATNAGGRGAFLNFTVRVRQIEVRTERISSRPARPRGRPLYLSLGSVSH